MSVVGSLIFCLDCGNLLDSPSVVQCDHITCLQCGTKYAKSSFMHLKVETSSAPDAFPSSLRLKKSVVKTSLKENELEDGATINEKCSKCGNNEMRYQTLQLRSADEGATVFYTCTSCGHMHRTNN